MLGWIKYVFVTHWLQFSLLTATWFGGYIIHDHLTSPLLVLYYAAHIFAAAAFFGVGMFYLHPGNKDIALRLHSSAPQDITRIVHRIIFHVLRALPFTGALIFLVPDSGYELGKGGSFWLTHVYNDNFAHMLHGMLFYLIVVAGLFNFLFVLNRRRQGR